jgi:ribosomal-protein-alanine N-acetyltransferase
MGSLAIRSLQRSHQIPVLETPRLVLRPYAEADIPALIRLAGEREVAATTLRIPHPYTEQNAREYLAICQAESNSGPVTRFAITLRSTGEFCGGAGLRLDPAHAARAVIDYGFGDLGLHRIYASHFAGNDASGRILRKVGMHHEGCMRGHIRKWDSFHDLECYGMLESDRSSQH